MFVTLPHPWKIWKYAEEADFNFGGKHRVETDGSPAVAGKRSRRRTSTTPVNFADRMPCPARKQRRRWTNTTPVIHCRSNNYKKSAGTFFHERRTGEIV